MPAIMPNSEQNGDNTGKFRAQCNVCLIISTFSADSIDQIARVATAKGWLCVSGDKYTCPGCIAKDVEQLCETYLKEPVDLT